MTKETEIELDLDKIPDLIYKLSHFMRENSLQVGIIGSFFALQFVYFNAVFQYSNKDFDLSKKLSHEILNQCIDEILYQNNDMYL